MRSRWRRRGGEGGDLWRSSLLRGGVAGGAEGEKLAKEEVAGRGADPGWGHEAEDGDGGGTGEERAQKYHTQTGAMDEQALFIARGEAVERFVHEGADVEVAKKNEEQDDVGDGNEQEGKTEADRDGAGLGDVGDGGQQAVGRARGEGRVMFFNYAADDGHEPELHRDADGGVHCHDDQKDQHDPCGGCEYGAEERLRAVDEGNAGDFFPRGGRKPVGEEPENAEERPGGKKSGGGFYGCPGDDEKDCPERAGAEP